MLEKNPAYLAAAKEIQVSAEKIRVERSGYLPTLNGQYSWSTFIVKYWEAISLQQHFQINLTKTKSTGVL